MEKTITTSDISKTTNNPEESKKLSEIIIKSKDLELNYQAILTLGINKIKHLEVIIESCNPIYNYKCIKHCMRTETLTIEEKKSFIEKHTKIVLNSNNEKLIKELRNFLKYNKLQANKPSLWDSSKKHKNR